jgi:TolB-like protein
VLPFANAGDDPEQRFLAEGLAQDIITALTRHKDLTVISRQSSFAFGAQSAVAGEAAESLGVRFVLTGSVRRAGPRIRVSVQLIDAGHHASVWAERYDREAADLFVVQDEIVAEVAATLDTELRQAERQRAIRLSPDKLDAWELFHRGLWHAFLAGPRDLELAADFFERSIARSADFAMPHAGLAYVEALRANRLLVTSSPEAVARGLRYAEKALSLDGGDPFVLSVLGMLLAIAGQSERALAHFTQARQLNPNYALAHYALSLAHFWAGRPGDARQAATEAMKLAPREPLAAMQLAMIVFCSILLGDHAAALAAARQATQLQPLNVWTRVALAIAHVELGDLDEGRLAIEEAQRLVPNLTCGIVLSIIRAMPEPIRARAQAALRAVGLPE